MADALIKRDIVRWWLDEFSKLTEKHRNEPGAGLMVYAMDGADAVIKTLREKLDVLPTADAVPVVHGRWVRAAGKKNIWYCSVCGDKINYKQNRRTYNIPKVPVEQKNKFCRNCGAKMDLVEET